MMTVSSNTSAMASEVDSLDERPLQHVAVGVLWRDHQFLMTSRSQGRVYEGYWEFPGGKLEAGETVEQALIRELEEELGVVATQIVAWRELEVSYPHARVLLHFCKVLAWTHDLDLKEAQQASWQQIPVTVSPVLPGSLPVLEWIEQEIKSL